MTNSKSTVAPAKKETQTKKQDQKKQTNAKGSVKVSVQEAKNINNPTKNTQKATASKNQTKSPAPASKNQQKQANKDDTDKKPREHPNQATANIKAILNVNYAGNHLKEYITKTLGSELGTINAKYPYTVIAEIVATYIARSAAKFNEKKAREADMYVVTLENILRTLRESADFGPELRYAAEQFDPTSMNYIRAMFVDEPTFRKFFETRVFDNASNVTINDAALNFMAYLTLHCLSRVTKTACTLSEYAKKKNVLVKNFKFACNIHFSGTLHKLLTQRIDEVEAWCSTKDKTDDDASEASDEVASSKKSKGKKAVKDVEEVEEDEEEDEEEEEEEEEEEDDE